MKFGLDLYAKLKLSKARLATIGAYIDKIPTKYCTSSHLKRSMTKDFRIAVKISYALLKCLLFSVLDSGITQYKLNYMKSLLTDHIRLH